jgi:hypothetical protein
MYRLRKGGIFLTVKDLMLLTGSCSYQSCSRLHRTIRDAIAANKRKITIREYCNYEGIDYTEIWEFLRVK